MKRGILCMILTAAIIGGMWLASPRRAFQNRPVVSVSAAASKNIYDSVLARGSVEEGAARKIRLGHDARVDALHVRVGDSVAEGELLMQVSEAEAGESGVESVLALLPALTENQDALARVASLPEDMDYSAALAEFYTPRATSEEFMPDVTAPISGVVTALSVQEGDVASGQSVVAAISDFHALQIRVRVPELYIQKVRVGQPAEITGEAFSQTPYRAVVAQISPTAKQKTSLTGSGETCVEVLLTINEEETVLRPGYSVSAKIYTENHENAVIVPYTSVQQDEEGREFVFLEQDGALSKRAIRTGLELDNEVEILAGIQAGERVVIDPSDALAHGAAVRVREGA